MRDLCQKNLVNVVRRMRKWPRQIRIVRGGRAKDALKQQFEQLGASRSWPCKIVIPAA